MNDLTLSALGTLIPFDADIQLPAELAMLGQDEFSSGQKVGFPVLSIKGGKFAISRSGEREVIKKPGSKEAAGAIDVVIIRAAPGTSKIYYKDKYVEGNAERPDCYSNDGLVPANDARAPQCTSCAACTHNQWGSRMTDDGRKAKSCQDAKRLVVAAGDALDDPMLLKLPATSLKPWDQYVKLLKRRGVTPPMVATRLSFDADAPHPLLEFEPIGILPTELAAEVMRARENETTMAIIEATLTEANEILDTAAPSEELAAKAAVVPMDSAKRTRKRAAPQPKSDATLADVVQEAEAAPAAEIQVEEGDSLLAELGDALDDFDDGFDD